MGPGVIDRQQLHIHVFYYVRALLSFIALAVPLTRKALAAQMNGLVYAFPLLLFPRPFPLERHLEVIVWLRRRTAKSAT